MKHFTTKYAKYLYLTGFYGYGFYLGHVNRHTALFYDVDGDEIVEGPAINLNNPIRELEEDEIETIMFMADTQLSPDHYKLSQLVYEGYKKLTK